MAERKAATNGHKRAQQPVPPRTLMQAHEALVAIRPKGNASLAAWKNYYEQSVALYQQIAEIDRGHHHEALYWADREQKSADEIAARISTGQGQNGGSSSGSGVGSMGSGSGSVSGGGCEW